MPSRQLQCDSIQLLYSTAVSRCICAVLYCDCCMETHLHVHVSLEGEELCCNCVTCSCFSRISSATEIYPLIIAIFSVSVVVAVVI